MNEVSSFLKMFIYKVNEKSNAYISYSYNQWRENLLITSWTDKLIKIFILLSCVLQNILRIKGDSTVLVGANFFKQQSHFIWYKDLLLFAT